MKLRHISIVVLCALALAACGDPVAQPVVQPPTIAPRTPTPAVAGTIYRVQRGEVVDLIALSGRVAAAVDQDAFFQQNGFVKAVHVKRDDQVSSGQLLAELDPGDLLDRLSQAQADRDSAQHSLAQSQHQRQLSIASAELALQNAQGNLDRLRQPVSAFEIDEAQAAIERAKLNLNVTRRTASAAKTQASAAMLEAANVLRNRQAEYSKVTWENGNQPLDQLEPAKRDAQERAQRALEDAEAQLTLAQQAYEDARRAEVDDVMLAEQDVRAAERKLEALQAGTSSFDIADAERGVRSAQIALETARATDVNPGMVERIAQSQREIERIQKQIDATRLTAPFDGVVAEVSVRPGDQVEAYTPVVNVMNPATLEIVVNDLPNEDLARLAVGQAVSISLAQDGSATIPGAISKLPGNQAATSAVKGDLALRISFDPTGHDLAVGDPARITITLQRVESTLWLPPQAITTFDQRHFVSLKDGGQQRDVDITIGIVTPERVEILAGLHEGDEVVAATVGR
jgi:multidrug efflux pump subunit AcrA (membrane-fusion protein)